MIILGTVSITPFVIATSSVNNYTLLHKECLRAYRINKHENLYKNNAARRNSRL